MEAFEITVNQANVNLENGTVILTGVDLSELVNEVGAYKLLQAIDFGTINDYVAEELAYAREENEAEEASK